MTTTALKPIDQVRDAITKMAPQFKMALPSHVQPEKFQRVVLTALQQTPSLLECDRASLYGAAMKAAQDGLLPDGREGAIIPRKGKAAWMPMVAGIMKKVRNSGEISTWSVQVVKENDAFDYHLGDDEKIIHKPALRDRGETIGAYSIVTLKDGEKSREFMDIDQINSIRERSDGYRYAVSKGNKDNPWISDPDEMAKKTVVRRHSKRLPMSTDLDEFLRQDDELYMPPEPQQAAPAPKDVTPAAEQPPAKPKRPGRLDKVVDMQQAVDDDMHVMSGEPPSLGGDYIPPGDPAPADAEYPI